MKSLLVALAILMQTAPQPVGVVTGVVRGANGMPAPGVRVYAIGVRDTLEALNTGTAPLEGLTQTDRSGRYRLEVSPGRYYIASGSVNAPTFYPGTAKAADARVVTVASGGLIEAIDFSSFVPASRSGLGIAGMVSGTGFLSGILRFPDGTPAAGIPVVLATAASVAGGPSTSPASAPPLVGSNVLQLLQTLTPGAFVFFATGNGARFLTSSDVAGRFTVSNVSADTYYIAAGYAESSALYPGVADVTAAKTIATTPTTNINNLDFTVPRPPTGSGTVRGRVTATGNAPIGGVQVEILSASPSAPSAFGLPTLNPGRSVDSSPDGRFEFAGVRTGTYVVRASYSALYSESKNVVVADQPLDGVDFLLRAASLSGRVLDETGSPIPDVRLFADAVVSTVSNPNIIASTIFTIANDGSFGRILEAEEYRFFLRTLPEEYSLKSITADGVDLMKETLKFTGTAPVRVDIRVAKRTTASGPSGVSIKGRTTDALTDAPSAAERITLCCRESGPIERFSTPLQTDGSFEFAAIPPGRFTVGLQTRVGTPSLFAVPRDIDVGADGASRLELFSTLQFAELSAKLVLENGGLLPENFSATVVFTGTNGRVRVTATSRDGTYFASVPAGDRYTVLVTNLPEGYAVKSSGDSMEARPGNVPAVGGPTVQPPRFQAQFIITLTRESR